MAIRVEATVVDVATHPMFSNYKLSDWVKPFLIDGRNDGAHHKDWVIDQIARIIFGTPVVVTEVREVHMSGDTTYFRYDTATPPSPEYQAWVAEITATYGYNTGIAP